MAVIVADALILATSQASRALLIGNDARVARAFPMEYMLLEERP